MNNAMKEKLSGLGGTFGKSLAKVGETVAQGTQKVLVEPSKAVVQQAKVMTQKLIVTPVKPAAQAVEKQASQMIHSATQTANLLLSSGSKNKSVEQQQQQQEAEESLKAAVLPPDEQVVSMDILFTKQLANVSPQDWYNKFWCNPAVYEEYLQASNNQGISIGAWDEAQAIVNPYDEETYSHRRTLQYRFEKTIVGTKVAPKVTTVEHCRVTDDRCVGTMSTDCLGVPFGDAFQVQLRWVGTRMGENDLLLQLGLFVMFRKSVLVAGQIRSASRTESMQAQLQLFEYMKETCGAQESTVVDVGAATIEGGHEDKWDVCSMPPLSLIQSCIPKPSERVLRDDLDREMVHLLEMLQTLATMPLVEEQRSTVHVSLAAVEDSLDAILVRILDLEDTAQQTSTDERESTEQSKTSSLFKTNLIETITSPVERLNSVQVRRVMSKTVKRVTNHPSYLISSATRSNQQGINNSSNQPVIPGFDKCLQSMDVVVSKVFHNVTMKELYDAILMRQTSVGREPTFQTLLRNSGKLDIEIGEWAEQKGSGKGFVDPWCKESFSQKRNISFTSPNMSDNSFLVQELLPDKWKVQQTQYYRQEPEKLVLQVTEKTTGTFFSKSVKTFRRLVVSQIEDKKILFKVGIFILLARPVLFSSKIRAKETQESRRMYTELFQKTRAVVTGESVTKSLDERYEFEGIEEDKPSFLRAPLGHLSRVFRLSSTPVLQDDPQLRKKITTVHGKLKLIDELLDDREANSGEDLNFFKGELLVAHEALDSALVPSL